MLVLSAPASSSVRRFSLNGVKEKKKDRKERKSSEINDSVGAPLMTEKSEPDAERIYQLNS